jgi:Putative metallopeptidase
MTWCLQSTILRKRKLLICAACVWLTAACASSAHAGGQIITTQPTPLTLADFENGVVAAMRELENEPTSKGMSEQERREQIEFVAGNVMFATAHEVGHMLIAELGLPVLGREEDAADAYATLTGLRHVDKFSDRVLTNSAWGWFLSDQRDQADGTRTPFYDEHGLDRQRAYNIVCLMVGGDPDRFAKLADMSKMPADRQGTCQGDFSNASWSWERSLTAHIRKPDEAKTKFTVRYVDSDQYQALGRGFRQIKILETLAHHLSDRYAWRRPIDLVMTSCGTPNAHWDLATHSITVCYELAADFADLYRGYGAKQKVKP